jgi:outer membrane lipoprotein-sorting protein
MASIHRARQRLRTLDASFTQERSLSLLDTSVTSKGRLRLSGSDRLRWDIDPPDQITYWIANGLVSYRSASSKGQVVKRNAGSMGLILDDLFIALSGDLRRLLTRHQIRCERQDALVLVRIRPNDPASAPPFRQIELALAPDLISPRHILMEESESDRIRIQFDSVRTNEPIEPDVFVAA